MVYRRDDLGVIETSEAGAAGAARMQALGAYRYDDLGVDSYAGTYQAPFLRSSPLGRAYKFRLVPNYYGQATVRYRAAPSALRASLDGTPFVDVLGIAGHAERAVRNPWILDAPFMTGALLLPAFRRRSREASLAPVSEAFPSGVGAVGQRLVRAAPTFPKTPKGDLAVDVPGVVRVWFDPATYVVHEVHFTAVNFDARLVSFVKGNDLTAFTPQVPPAPEGPLPREAATMASADGTSLSALLSRPPNATKAQPAIVLVPPGPDGGAGYSGDGPNPMFPALALALVGRGYTVLRYDMRGVGKSGGSTASETWDDVLADVRAAVGELTADATVDPKRVYLLGYGNGADLALAASAPGSGVAGVVALAPTVLGYRNCPAALAGAGAGPSGAAWRKSASAHDVTALATRTRAPLLVLHPGVPVCNETKDQGTAYDDRLREANPLATIIAASDLTARFGSRYEAESPVNTEEFFPYRFDASTATAIADWLDNPKTAAAANASRGIAPGTPNKPPPAPPGVDKSGAGMPKPRRSGSPPTPLSAEPGVVLPSGVTPPPSNVPPPAPTATPVPTPRPAVAPLPAPVAPPSASVTPAPDETPTPQESSAPAETPAAPQSPAATATPQ